MNKALVFVILPFFVFILGLCTWAVIASIHPNGPTEYNYNRIRGGMNVAEVSDILGEGEIYCSDNRGMVSMRYVGKGVKIYVTFIDGLVYQATIKQGNVIPDGEYLYPETEL
jgi:hypothetical protein